MRHIAIDLSNSYHLRGKPGVVDDELDDPAWVAGFAARWSLGEVLDHGGMAELRALRAALRNALDELTESRTLSAAALDGLNAFARPIELRSVLVRGGEGVLLRQESALQPLHASHVVLRAFQDLVAGEGAQRLKLCANPLCRWAFYDESRNRSRRWCDSAECGNVMKVRAFRERQTRPTPTPEFDDPDK